RTLHLRRGRDRSDGGEPPRSQREALLRHAPQNGRPGASARSVLLMAKSERGAAGLRREQLLELYYWMRLTRTLEERLVALYRQTKVVGGLFRSLGQEADAVGSTYALERRDIMSPLIRNLGSMLVKGATPVEV